MIDALETRMGTALAARYLGVTRRHVEKLVRDGVLVAWDLRRPGATRAHYVVSLASVRELLLERVRKERTEGPRAVATVAAPARGGRSS